MAKQGLRVTLIAAAVISLAGSGAAQAHSPQLSTVTVHTHYTEPDGTYDGAQCGGLGALKPECHVHYLGRATFTGTMYGDVSFDLTTPTASQSPGHITYEGPDNITGGVVGCGTGSYVIVDSNGDIDMTKYDPITNSAPGYNTWKLRPGSGTGELTNLLSGEGENHWREYFSGKPGAPDTYGEGDFTGTITCRR